VNLLSKILLAGFFYSMSGSAIAMEFADEDDVGSVAYYCASSSSANGYPVTLVKFFNEPGNYRWTVIPHYDTPEGGIFTSNIMEKGYKATVKASNVVMDGDC